MRILRLILCVLVLGAVLPANGQTATLATNDDWHRVEQIAPHTQIKIWTDRKHTHCFVDSVDETKLICSHSAKGSADAISFPRAEVKTIKLARRGHSTMGGMLLGAAIGAGAGGGITYGINHSQNSGGFVTGGEAFGVGAGIFGVVGLGVGAGVGHSTDWLAGPTIYSRH